MLFLNVASIQLKLMLTPTFPKKRAITALLRVQPRTNAILRVVADTQAHIKRTHSHGRWRGEDASNCAAQPDGQHHHRVGR